MMERYQKAMGRIHAPADTKKKLLGSTTRPRRSVFARVLPVAACLLLLAAGCVGLYFAEKEPVMPVGQSYDDIYEAWRSNRGNQGGYYGETILGGGGIDDAVINGDIFAESQGTTILGPSPDHYETHMQTEGVLESDLQKTDGRYLWRFDRTTLYTYRLAGGETELLESTAMPEECGRLYAMFFWEGRLALIGAADTYTYAYLFDVDPASGIPRLAETFRQSGVYKDSRIVNGELYLVTNHYAGMPRDDEELDIEKHIPKIAVGDEERLLKPEEIYLCEEIVTSRYSITFSVVSAIDLEEKLFDSTKAVLSNSYVLYASAESIYLFAYGDHDTTQIFRFAMDKENTVLTRTGEVEGNVLNQFSVDEHDGYLRLATSVNWSILIGGEHFSGHHNCVYVLDKDLQILGALEKIQPDERIYSARFSGDLCYLVTFRQTDPLFAIDLSDPSEPEILSELKVTGFSSYLYEYGDGLLLGFGAEGTETGTLTGWKLSMFDVADPEDVTEIANRVISRKLAWGATWYDHNNLMISKERNLIGVPLEGYQLYTYEEEGRAFVLLGHYTVNGNKIRGTYAGKYCYVTSTMGLIAIDLESYEVVAEIDIAQ